MTPTTRPHPARRRPGLRLWSVLLAGLLTGLLTALGSSGVAAAVPRPGVEQATGPIVLGHRGASLPRHPESALSTLVYAADWADIVEVDLQWTSDGVPVLLHDLTLDRTTTCSGAVATRTWAQVRRCELKRTGRRPTRWDPGARIETVPAFAQVLTAMRRADRQALMAEIGPQSISDAQALDLIALVRRAGMADRLWLESMFPANLDQVRRLGGDDLATTYLMRGFATPLPPVSTVREYGGIVMPRYVNITREQVAAYQREGVQVWAWTASTPEQTAAILALGVDGVFTDDPEGLRRQLTDPS